MAAVIAPKRFATVPGPAQPPTAPRPASPRARPVSLAQLIDALLENADLRQDLGAGRSLVRLSAGALARVRRLSDLGEAAGRLADLAVVWDEREDELVRVLDGTAQTVVSALGEDRFELTGAALAYLEASGGPGRP